MLVTKVWLNGCFDGFHYAHANAIRQAKQLPDLGAVEVVAGVHPDAEITKHKGPPLFNEKERYSLLKGCRWISRIEVDVPYATRSDVFERYDVDLVVHGDDLAVDADGNDCYAMPKALGKYREASSSKGISTTSLIERILHRKITEDHETDDTHLQDLLQLFSESCIPRLPVIDLHSANVERLFPSIDPGEEEAVLAYIEGDWDCFCAGHVEVLRCAREAAKESSGVLDTNLKLVVGVGDDQAAERRLGEPPIYVQRERALGVAQCRYVDAIVMKSGNDLSTRTLQIMGINIVMACTERKKLVPPESLSRKDGLKRIPVLMDDEHLVFYTPGRLRERLQSNLAAYEERQIRKLNSSTI